MGKYDKNYPIRPGSSCNYTFVLFIVIHGSITLLFFLLSYLANEQKDYDNCIFYVNLYLIFQVLLFFFIIVRQKLIEESYDKYYKLTVTVMSILLYTYCYLQLAEFAELNKVSSVTITTRSWYDDFLSGGNTLDYRFDYNLYNRENHISEAQWNEIDDKRLFISCDFIFDLYCRDMIQLCGVGNTTACRKKQQQIDSECDGQCTYQYCYDNDPVNIRVDYDRPTSRDGLTRIYIPVTADTVFLPEKDELLAGRATNDLKLGFACRFNPEFAALPTYNNLQFRGYLKTLINGEHVHTSYEILINMENWIYFYPEWFTTKHLNDDLTFHSKVNVDIGVDGSGNDDPYLPFRFRGIIDENHQIRVTEKQESLKYSFALLITTFFASHSAVAAFFRVMFPNTLSKSYITGRSKSQISFYTKLRSV